MNNRQTPLENHTKSNYQENNEPVGASEHFSFRNESRFGILNKSDKSH